MEDEEILPQTITASQEKCVERFKELWDIDEMAEIIDFISPNILKIHAKSKKPISNNHRLAEILFESVGSRFLRNIESDTGKRRKFLYHLLNSAISKRIISKDDFIAKAIHYNAKHSAEIASSKDPIEYIAFNIDAKQTWTKQLAIILGFPTSVSEKDDNDEEFYPHETVLPALDLNPLYDYQYSTGLEVRKLLEGKIDDKRILISVPTGAGKTRMIVETLIEWLNDGKPSKNTQQSNSKFILWIAQSQELCEQATSAFKSTFQARGKNGTALHLHRYWGDTKQNKELPISFEKLEEEYSERSIIVSTIQSLNAVNKKSPQIIERLSELTSCIVIDEAHHSIADSYRDFLELMGFNINLRKQEMSTKGIILVGLTATPFRGSGDNQETEQLLRRYGRLYFPTIPYSENEENFKPHALIDCQTFAQVGDDVRIIGERSYDRDGFIKTSDFKWKIIKVPKKISEIYSNSENSELKEWTFEKIQNIDFSFPEEGEYKITLEITDNEGEKAESSVYISIKPKSAEDKIPDSQKQKSLYKKLISRKILCDVHHYILKSDQIELSREEEEHLRKWKELKTETIKQIGTNEQRNELIIKTIHEVKTKFNRNKILFFGCSIEHSRHIAKSLNIIHDMNTRYVDSKMNIDQRVDAIEKFKNGDVEVLCNFDVLTTGFDAPNINCVFVGRPIHSTLLYTQIIGRGLRGIKSGGTDDVLLIDIDDNFQLKNKYGIQNSVNGVTLGWKVFSEYWKPWKPTEQNELIFESSENSLEKLYCKECGNSASGIEEIKRIFEIENDSDLVQSLENKDWKSLPQICKVCQSLETNFDVNSISQVQNISSNSNDIIEKQCPKCGKTAQNERIETEFGYRMVNDKKIPQSYCRECRSEKKHSSKCPFVEFLENQRFIQGNYQMILGLYAIATQKGDLPKANLLDACNNMIQFNPGKNRSQINKDHSVFTVYVKNGLIKNIDVISGEIIFETILDLDGFEKLCESKLKEYNEKIKQKQSLEKIDSSSAEQIDIHYGKLKNTHFGHVPTTSQFQQCTSTGLIELMNQLYGGYSNYLDAKGDAILDDPILKDSLYEEYFELLISTKHSISKEALDEYGDYRLNDYVECFGNYEKFEKIITEILEKLKNISHEIEFDDVFQDYDRISTNLGRHPHFEEIRSQSYIGIEYYIHHFGTIGQFKKIFTLKPDERYFKYTLRNSFFNLKKLLLIIPNYRQMKRFSGLGTKFEEQYSQSNYYKFLHEIGESGVPFSDDDLETKQQIQNNFSKIFSDNIQNFGEEKSIKILFDEDSIPYVEWFDSKESFIQKSSRPDLLNMFNVRKEQKISIPSKSDSNSEFEKSKLCPHCNSELEIIDNGVVCKNIDCGFYKMN